MHSINHNTQVFLKNSGQGVKIGYSGKLGRGRLLESEGREQSIGANMYSPQKGNPKIICIKRPPHLLY